ncbi:hypothetical protein ACHAW6_013260 [Cyclotella cf. meneghiniana]
MRLVSTRLLFPLSYCCILSNSPIPTAHGFSLGHRAQRRHPIVRQMSSSTANNEANSRTITKLDGISSPEILKHDTFLLDMWGVMHNGHEPYEGVLETIRELKERGKKLTILSNSSKRRDDIEIMLEKLGFNLEDFENIITSGDISHVLLRNDAPSLGCSNWEIISNLIQNNQRKVFVFGSGDNDESYCISAGWTLAPIQEADLIVSRGTFTINDGTTVVSKTDNEDEYWSIMERSMMIAAQRKVPMLVTNPDKVRPDASRNPMPGSIGDTYERFLWTSHCPPMGEMSEENARTYVKRIGKPFQEVYDIALHGSDSSKAIMIGDALETDITGGNAIGCSTVWVIKDGIHNVDVEEKGMQRVVDGFNANSEVTYAYGKKVTPDYAVDNFRW